MAKPMIEVIHLERFSEELRVYDVVQNAWEHEGEGLEINADHVMMHLVRNLIYKKFSDKQQAMSEVAPDALAYGLRFARWTHLPAEAVLPTVGVEQVARARSLHALVPMYQGAFMEATGLLADSAHNLDHASQRETALEQLPTVAHQASRLLVYSALSHAQRLDFDIGTAFTQRLDNLRDRFNIPHIAA